MNKNPNEKIVRMTLDEVKQKHLQGDYGQTDWDRLDALTDNDIEKAVKDDPDAAPLVDSNFWNNADIVLPAENYR